MTRTRIIPVLLLNQAGFYKTRRFKEPTYLGDPVNILRIFNEKEVDEISILDIAATLENREPNFALLEDMASECFMPLAYGGGINSIAHIHRLFKIGYEKIVLNSATFAKPQLIAEAAALFGSQSVVVCIDVKKGLLGGYEVVYNGARKKSGWKPADWALHVAGLGAGEVIINSVDRDGTMEGYDLDLISSVTQAVSIPVVACGGARNVGDFAQAVKQAHASACAAGAMFVFQGRHRAVLINVPSPKDLKTAMS